MTQETALVRREISGLEVYGNTQEVIEFALALKEQIPGGSKLTNSEALALARISIACDLNPFLGEVWYIPGSGPMAGIKGLRKYARRQGNYWVETTPLTQEEREANGIPDNAIAYKAELYQAKLMRESAEIYRMMKEAGHPSPEQFAYRPIVGIGYWLPHERTKMKGDQAARKRAEAEALKVVSDIPIMTTPGRPSDEQGEAAGYIDGDYTVTIPMNEVDTELEKAERQAAEAKAKIQAMTAEARDANLAANSRILQGDPDFEGFDTPSTPKVTTATGQPTTVYRTEPAESTPTPGQSPDTEAEKPQPEAPQVEDEARVPDEVVDQAAKQSTSLQELKATLDTEIARMKAEKAEAEAPPYTGQPIGNCRWVVRSKAGWLKQAEKDYSDALRVDGGPPANSDQMSYVQFVREIARKNEAEADTLVDELVAYLLQPMAWEQATGAEVQGLLYWLRGDKPSGQLRPEVYEEAREIARLGRQALADAGVPGRQAPLF